MYPHLISERVKKWRAEIETLTRANLENLKGENSYMQEANRQRRAERLRDIMNELKALTEWKKA
jgi:beta-lactamase class A